MIVCLAFLISEAVACPLELPTIQVSVNDTELNLAIAATPGERECGLSNRDTLPPNTGMLFVLPEPMPFAVWMKGTRIPLSVAFINLNRRIVAIEQMDPLKTVPIYTSGQPVRYAIEVPRGWFRQHRIRVGDIIDLVLPSELEVR